MLLWCEQQESSKRNSASSAAGRRGEISPDSMATPWANRGRAAVNARLAAVSRLPRLRRLLPCGRNADLTESDPLYDPRVREITSQSTSGFRHHWLRPPSH